MEENNKPKKPILETTDYDGRSRWRLSIVIFICLLIITPVIFITVDIIRGNSSFGPISYGKGISKFELNENKSLIVLDSIGFADAEYLREELNISLDLWIENTTIIDKLFKIKNLSEDRIVRCSKLAEYCELRMEQFELIIKGVEENTYKYDNKIKKIEDKIEEAQSKSH